jgi:hypothetical protein
MDAVACIGVSLDPFSVTLEGEGCQNCVPQPGDWVQVTAVTIHFVDITTSEWSLCGGTCRGKQDKPRLGAGPEF